MTTATVLITPSSTTTYTVIGTNASGCTSSDEVTVTVNPVPIVNIPPAFFCTGYSITLDAGNPGSTFNWSTGESTQAINVSDSGTYTVVVTSPNGCPAMGSVVVTEGGVNSAPVNYNVCAGQSATLNAGNSGSTYQWSTGQTTQTINVGSAGNYFVTITDFNGCVATLQHSVAVNPIPTASFSNNTVCEGVATTFVNNSSVSSGTIQNTLWDFGDGNSSSTFNTSHQYFTQGSYTVTLISTSQAGCSDTTSHAVTINPLPAPDFSTNSTCQNKSVTFTNQSTISSGSIISWNWNYGDGLSSTSASPVHAYANAGTYTATLLAVSNFGCTDTVNRTINILTVPNAAFNVSNACTQSSISITNNSSTPGSPISNYQWNLGNGNTSTAFQPTFQYAASGTYNIQLIVTSQNGCSDTVSSNVTAYPLPVANFSTNPACAGSSVTFTNNSSVPSGSIQNYYWTFGDNSSAAATQPVHTYNTEGSYTVNLITTSNLGCRDTTTQTVTINPNPVVSFISPDVCLGEYNQFQNTSTITSGTINSWLWTFNDGFTSQHISPNHEFNQPGTYNVILSATSNLGCTSSTSMQVNIFPNPVAGFTTANVCFGSNTQFVNQSTLVGGGDLNYHWTFSDGDSANSTNPIHAFDSAGTYTVELQVTSPSGCIDRKQHGLEVYHLPVARFAAPNACSGTPVTFTNQSSSQDGMITAFLWGFGDGSFSFDENPVHQYSDSGQFNVDLITITSFGCAGSFSDSLSVYSHPTVDMVVNNSCVGTPIQFSSSSQSGQVNYQWTFGNGYTSNASSFSYAFNNPGTYSVNLVATSTNGCTAIKSDILNVYPNPVASFTNNEVCQLSQTVFNNQSSLSEGVIAGYTWNFGDGQQSGSSNPTHTYTSSGSFNTNLAVTSDKGCVTNITKVVDVHPNPVVNFNAGAQGCSPVSATFNGSASIVSGTVAGWLWNFGDGEVSTDPNPQHIYSISGNYNVTVTAVSDHGCMTSTTHSNVVNVYPQPTADFIADPMIVDIEMPIVHFTNQSSGYATFHWNFGDGTSTSTDLNPVHTFGDTGTYSAYLITTNSYGCKDSVLRIIDVRLHSTLFIANCFTPNGDGNNDTFRPFYTNMEEIKVWIFDRWGKLLTSWNDLNGSWDGYYKGNKCQSDTYVYKIAGTGLDGKQSEWIGHVSIVY